MPRPRAQDVLFAILGLVVVILALFDIQVAVLALVGAFACGALYVFAGMLPDRTESFLHRIFISGFLSIVLSSLVLILPGTFGLQGPHPDLQKAVVVIAGLIPLAAIGFEVVRTPRVIKGILWCLGYR
jgi:drug/metabolite transporter (DMT)-like permease